MNLSLQYKLKQLLAVESDLELAILVGSQAKGTATPQSDWDIAIRWERNIDPMHSLGKTETFRRMLANHLNLPETKIDLIDLTKICLTMSAVVAEEGIVIKGEDSLAWNYFLQRTWRELETYYWNKNYAA